MKPATRDRLVLIVALAALLIFRPETGPAAVVAALLILYVIWSIFFGDLGE